MISKGFFLFLFLVLGLVMTSCLETNSEKTATKEKTVSAQKEGSPSPDTSLGNMLLHKGNQYQEGAHYDSALVFYEKASAIYEQKEAWADQVVCFNKIALILFMKGEHDKEKEYLSHAIRIGLKRLGNHPEILRLQYKMGVVYWTTGDYENAISYYQQALSLLQTLVSDEKDELTAKIYNALGVVHAHKGYYDKAREFLEKALAINLSVFDGEKHSQIARNYGNLGLVSLNKTDYDDALIYFEKTLSVLLTLQSKMDLIANTYNNMGLVYEEKKEYDKALSHYEKAVSLFKQSLGESHYRVAISYFNIGKIHSIRQDYDKALQYHNRALAIRVAGLGEQHPDVAASYNSIATTYFEKSDYQQALNYHKKALSISINSLGVRHPDVAMSYHNIAEVFGEQSRYNLALEYCQKALSANVPAAGEPDQFANPPLENVFSAEMQLTTLLYKAKVLTMRHSNYDEKHQDLEVALATYQTATELIDRMRNEIKTENSKLLLAAKANEAYNAAIQTALR